MTDLQAAAAAVGSLRAAFDLTKTMLDVAGSVKAQQKVIELQGVIVSAQSNAMSAQQAQVTLTARVTDLEQQVVQFKDWETEKQRYQMKAVDTGAFAYMHKAGMENGEPPHWLCTNCFDKRQRSILQSRGQVSTVPGGRGMHAKWGCNACKGEIQVYYTRQPSVPWPKDEGAA